MATETKARVARELWGRRAAWCAVGVLLFWAIAWLAVPPLIKHQLEKSGGELLGRKVTVGAVDFKPWSLELTVNQLGIAAADGASAQLSIERLYLDVELQSLVRLAPMAAAITVEGAVLHLARLGPGKFDIDDVLQRLTPPADAEPSEPIEFALRNLSLSGAAVDFNDEGRVHAVRDLRLSVPALSNFTSRRDLVTVASLSFKLNGAEIALDAQSLPFAPTRKTSATLEVKALDISPYLPYLPAQLPVHPKAGVLAADLKIAFEQGQQVDLKIGGSALASNVELIDGRQQTLVGFKSLKVELDEVQPLASKASFKSIELDSPHLNATRDQDGRLNLALDFPKGDDNAAPWQISLASLALRDGSADWRDATTARGKVPAAQLRLQALSVDAADIALPWVNPMSFRGSAELVSGLPDAPPAASLQFDGSATDKAAKVAVTAKAVPLALVAPYAAQYLKPSLDGTLEAALALDWQAASQDDQSGKLRLAIPKLVLNKLALSQERTTLASVQSVELSDGELDLVTRAVSLGKLSTTDFKVKVERDRDQHWMFEQWLDLPKATEANTDRAAKPERPFSFAIKNLVLTGGQVAWLDSSTVRPVQFEISRLQVQLKPLVLGSRTQAALAASASIRTGQGEPGRLSYRGQLRLNQLATSGTIDARNIPVQAFEPYFAERLNMELLRADTSFKGKIAYADGTDGMRLSVSGDTTVEEFNANTLVGSAAGKDAGSGTDQPVSEELLSWKILRVDGLELAIAPATATVVNVGGTTLSDFYARINIREDGRVNLQDLVKPAAEADKAGAESDGVATLFNFGPTTLLAGKVYFSDHFIQPNYSADLSELAGSLGGFSSVPPGGVPQMAQLEVRGRAQGTATLEILGQINPLAKPLALDIKGRASDLELPPLSPYSVRYAGHGIERGKLSMDVSYKIMPDGQLTANNKLVLNQLAFGDKVEGAPASLPVKLAVALLADRNGVIDLDLPISGSLNDPQFSLGPVIFKVVVNLIGKAITAPFSLLASAFGGGGEEMSMVSFAPGSKELSVESKQRLDKVAKALSDRPALKMTVVGTANTDAEREGYKRERLGAMLQAEKRRALITNGGKKAPEAETETAVAVSDGEYPLLLREVYRRANFPKPRNAAGVAKELKPEEMEALLLSHIPVTDEVMRELAVQRGVAVKDYLVAQKLSVERLFLGAAKTVVPEPDWVPKAELKLDTR